MKHYLLCADSANVLNLSTRLRSCLEKHEIGTVGAFFAFLKAGAWKEEISGLTSLGRELQMWQERLENPQSGWTILDLPRPVVKDRELSTMQLPKGMARILKNAGYRTQNQLLDLTLNQIFNMPGMDMKKTSLMVHWLNNLREQNHSLPAAPQPTLQEQVALLVFRNQGYLDREDLLQHFPALDSAVLEAMQDEHILECQEGTFRRYLPTIRDYVEETGPTRELIFLKKRLKGKSFEEIGQEEGISRERVRQIVNRALDRKPFLREDRVKPYWGIYDICLEDFCEASGMDPWSFRYLEMSVTVPQSERKPLDSETLEDEMLPAVLRKRLAPIVHKREISVDSGWIPKKKNCVIDYIARTRCTEKTGMDAFQKYADEFLADHRLEEELHMDLHACENRLRDHPDILWNQKRHFRWYDTSSRDFSRLYDALDLKQYRDMELSTLKLFRENPDIMEEYDIQDEYELHNLLRKTCNLDIQFLRMPTIAIGKPDRQNQIREMLRAMAPVTSTEFAHQYEETYGVKASTVLGSYMSEFYPFYHDGIYSIPRRETDWMTEVQKEVMKRRLDRPCWSWGEIEAIFHEEFPDEPMDRVNPHSVKNLGFRVYSSGNGYVIKNTWPNANEYFQSVLFEKDTLDVGSLPESVRSNALFNTLLYQARSEGKLTELSPGFNVSKDWLDRHGLNEERIEAFLEECRDRIPDNTLFTIASLRSYGTSFSLDSMNLPDWFYSSLMSRDREHFSSSRHGKTRLMMKGKGQNLLQLLVRQLVRDNTSLTLSELELVLICLYDIRSSKDKLLKSALGANLYHDPVQDRLWLDVKSSEGQNF